MEAVDWSNTDISSIICALLMWPPLILFRGHPYIWHTTICHEVSLLVCLLSWTTYPKFQMSTLKYFTKIECPCPCVAARTRVKATVRLSGWKRERRRLKLNAFAAVTATYCPINLCYESDACATRRTMSDRRVVKFALGKYWAWTTS